MSVEDNKRVALTTANEIVCNRKLDLIDEVIHPDYRYTGPGGLSAHGPAGYRGLVDLFTSACSDLRSDVETVVAEGDWVSMIFRVTGANDGVFLGKSPTGRALNMRGIINCRIADGKVIEQVEMFDVVAMMRQLGLTEADFPVGDGDSHP